MTPYDRTDDTGRRYYLKPLRAMNQNDSREARPNLYYPLYAPDGSTVLPRKPDGSDGTWRWSQQKVEANPHLIEWVNGRNGWSPYYRIYADEHTTRPPETLWRFDIAGSNRVSKAEIRALFKTDMALTQDLKKGFNISVDPNEVNRLILEFRQQDLD